MFAVVELGQMWNGFYMTRFWVVWWGRCLRSKWWPLGREKERWTLARRRRTLPGNLSAAWYCGSYPREKKKNKSGNQTWQVCWEKRWLRHVMTIISFKNSGVNEASKLLHLLMSKCGTIMIFWKHDILKFIKTKGWDIIQTNFLFVSMTIQFLDVFHFLKLNNFRN